MEIRYVKTVKTPADKAGSAGQVIDQPEKTAQWLIDNEYAEPADKAGDNTSGDSGNTTPADDTAAGTGTSTENKG